MTGSPQPVQRFTIAQAVERAKELLRGAAGGRVLLGIVGSPGSGKSTLSEALAKELAQDAVIVGMDGFHLDNPLLEQMGRRAAKGALDTFDVDGYVSLLKRLKAADEPVTYAPRFDREIETSIGSAVAVPQEAPLVVTEGLYLLQEEAGWEQVRPLLDEVWFIDLPDEVRRQRLIARRLSHGHAESEARDWVMRVDEVNARRVALSAANADIRMQLVDSDQPIEETP
ncbi:MAG: nucleoside/nucleotide kinase family protein [Propionibacteriaceae bacterium]|nr:nucleoside/nucleotide kinase family protein [Propionibacteriaceae bacterium]